MSLFTTKSIVSTGVTTYRNACLVGNDIWLIQNLESLLWILKFNNETQTIERINFTMVGEHRERYKDFLISSSNGSIYIWACDENDDRQLLELNLITFEWKRLAFIEGITRNTDNFFMMDGKMYFTNWGQRMDVISMDTFQIVKTFDFEEINRRVIIQMNGLVYKVKVEETAIISIHQYDDGNNVFQQIMDKDERGRVQFDNYRENSFFAWSYNNKIYVTLLSHDRILINSFDVNKKQCVTVVESHFGKDAVMDVFGTDDKIYVLCEIFLDVVVREIDLNPNLETRALVRVADMIAGDDLTLENFNTCQEMLPYGLRTQFTNIVNWKSVLSYFGRMQKLNIEMIRLETGRAAAVTQFMELQQRVDMDQQELFKGIAILLFQVDKLTETCDNARNEYTDLQSEFISKSGERIVQFAQVDETEIERVENLAQQCPEINDQIIQYTVPLMALDAVDDAVILQQQQEIIEYIDQIENSRREQNEWFGKSQQRLREFIIQCRQVNALLEEY